MPETSEFAPGSFCWVDSGTDDLEKAKAFYAALFGWEYVTADDSGYTMCLRKGRPVAGLYPFDQDMIAMGATPYWLAYVAVADADAALAAATAAGAQPISPVFDVPNHGRGAAFAGPAGALCGIFQPGGHRGFGLAGEPGTAVWCELQTGDVEAAATFYAAVFGWRREAMPMADGPYYLFTSGEEQRAGMMANTPAMGEMPPNRQVYFQVDDADAALATARASGGASLVPVTPIETVGRFAALSSADGARFSILQPAPMG